MFKNGNPITGGLAAMMLLGAGAIIGDLTDIDESSIAWHVTTAATDYVGEQFVAHAEGVTFAVVEEGPKVFLYSNSKEAVNYGFENEFPGVEFPGSERTPGWQGTNQLEEHRVDVTHIFKAPDNPEEVVVEEPTTETPAEEPVADVGSRPEDTTQKTVSKAVEDSDDRKRGKIALDDPKACEPGQTVFTSMVAYKPGFRGWHAVLADGMLKGYVAKPGQVSTYPLVAVFANGKNPGTVCGIKKGPGSFNFDDSGRQVFVPLT